MSTESLFGTIKDAFKAQYPVNPQTGRPDIPPSHIYQALTSFFPNGYQEDVVANGNKSDGRPFVVIKLTVYDTTGNTATVLGAGEPDPGQDISYAGLLTKARENAVLRGLSMGESIYNNAADLVQVALPQRPSFQGKSGGGNGGGGYNRGPGQGGGQPRQERVWDGQLQVKNGQWAGYKYADLPIEVLQQWTSGDSPNQLAVKEMQRRINGAVQTQPSQGYNGPPQQQYQAQPQQQQYQPQQGYTQPAPAPGPAPGASTASEQRFEATAAAFGANAGNAADTLSESPFKNR